MILWINMKKFRIKKYWVFDRFISYHIEENIEGYWLTKIKFNNDLKLAQKIKNFLQKEYENSK